MIIYNDRMILSMLPVRVVERTPPESAHDL